MYKLIINQDSLMHHGIRGQKWGVRRYQNPDGSLTAKGKKHVGIVSDQKPKKPGYIPKGSVEESIDLQNKLNKKYGVSVDGISKSKNISDKKLNKLNKYYERKLDSAKKDEKWAKMDMDYNEQAIKDINKNGTKSKYFDYAKDAERENVGYNERPDFDYDNEMDFIKDEYLRNKYIYHEAQSIIKAFGDVKVSELAAENGYKETKKLIKQIEKEARKEGDKIAESSKKVDYTIDKLGTKKIKSQADIDEEDIFDDYEKHLVRNH